MIFWLWLQCCLGVDNSRIHRIFENFDNAEQIYLADENELRLSGTFTENELSKLINKNLDVAKRLYNNSLVLGYDIFSIKDNNYPKALKSIPTPPVVIYVKGKIPSENKLYVSMVGTRQPSNVGRDTAFSISYNLAKSGAVIVSGGALGIDMQAHKGAIQAGGETVCVLGCGINYNYLPSNENLRDEIVKHGAIISEYPPFYPPTKFTFPKRNRIISGLSDCTVIVEAGKNSGALITAKYATKQKKTVFAVPGSVDNINSQGSNMLIREGAKTALNSTDILSWYKSRKNNISDSNGITEKAVNNIINVNKKQKRENLKKSDKKEIFVSQTYNEKSIKPEHNNTDNISEQLTESALAVYDTISDEPVHVDIIKMKTGLPVNEILIALTELEMEELIIPWSGRRYIRK